MGGRAGLSPCELITTNTHDGIGARAAFEQLIAIPELTPPDTVELLQAARTGDRAAQRLLLQRADCMPPVVAGQSMPRQSSPSMRPFPYSPGYSLCVRRVASRPVSLQKAQKVGADFLCADNVRFVRAWMTTGAISDVDCCPGSPRNGVKTWPTRSAEATPPSTRWRSHIIPTS
jgi:hypothetical protein